MARPKKDSEHKKIAVKFYVLPSYIPIIKNVIKNLDENDAITYIQPQVQKKTEVVPEIQPESIAEEPVKKSSFGIDANEWIKQHTDKIVNIEAKQSQQVDTTVWQSDPLMQDIYNSCLWDAGGDNQCYPDGVEKYQIKYRALWARLTEAKRNNKNQQCNEIMTELMERIYNE